MIVIGAGRFDRGEQVHRCAIVFETLEFLRFESEGPGHAAATGLNRLDSRASTAQQRDFTCRLRQRPPCDDNGRGPGCAPDRVPAAAQSGALAASQSASSQTCSRKRRARGSLGKSSQQLVLEDAGTAWFEKDERQAGIDLRAMRSSTRARYARAVPEEAEIVERASAADVALRALHPEACGGENRFGCSKGLRVVVVVPGVRPQHHLRWG